MEKTISYAGFFTIALILLCIAVQPAAARVAQSDLTIVLSPPSAINFLGDSHTLTATVTDAAGAPVSGIDVTFTITSGPNAGKTATGVTDGNGEATFTYTSSVTGTDTIVAAFFDLVDDQPVLVTSNEAGKTWKEGTVAAPEFPTLAVPVGALLGLVFIIYSIRKN